MNSGKFRTLSADALVFKGHSVLLVKRVFSPCAGMYCLPGGRVDLGETLEQCALRELREEAGLEGKVVHFLGMYDDPKRDERGTVAAAFVVSVDGSAVPKTSDETSEVKFFPIDALPPLAFDHGKMVQDALKSLKWRKNQ